MRVDIFSMAPPLLNEFYTLPVCEGFNYTQINRSAPVEPRLNKAVCRNGDLIPNSEKNRPISTDLDELNRQKQMVREYIHDVN